jgi:hypothetical protein
LLRRTVVRSPSIALAVAVPLLVLAAGCASVPTADKEEKQAFILGSIGEMMAELYETDPELEGQVEGALGWAAFNYRLSKLPVVLGGLGGGGGYGVLVDNRTEERTFMSVRIGEWGVGVGTRIFGTLIVFEDEQVMRDFVRKGWEFGSTAEAAAKTSEGGVGVGGSVSTFRGMKVYHVTRQGVAYGATFRGTRYSRDRALN